MRISILFSMLTLFAYIPYANGQGIVSEQSSVSFEISNLRVRTVSGTISGMKGKAVFDQNNLQGSSFDICIDPSTIKTGNNKRDKHLKNEDFFDVEKHPAICFSSTKVSRQGKNYEVVGTLNMLGVSKEIKVPFTENNGLLKGKFSLNRFDYGLAANSYKSTFMVGKEVKMEIEIKLAD